ncbi:helix-turn-helix domain-containing protein [Dyadobacter jiangsuensis]
MQRPVSNIRNSAMHNVNIFDKRDYLLYFCNKKDMADEDRIVGGNIRQFRERLSMSQQELADFLGVTTPLISYYEGGSRSVPMLSIEKLASLFGVDAYDLFEENASLHTANTAFAFRADDLLNTDLEQIAQFRKIVKNYISMKNLAQANEAKKGENTGS